MYNSCFSEVFTSGIIFHAAQHFDTSDLFSGGIMLPTMACYSFIPSLKKHIFSTMLCTEAETDPRRLGSTVSSAFTQC